MSANCWNYVFVIGNQWTRLLCSLRSDGKVSCQCK